MSVSAVVERLQVVEDFILILQFRRIYAPEIGRVPRSANIGWCCAYEHTDLYESAVLEIRELVGASAEPVAYSYQARFCSKTARGDQWLFRLDWHGHDGSPPEPHLHDHRVAAPKVRRNTASSLSCEAAVLGLVRVLEDRAKPCRKGEAPHPERGCIRRWLGAKADD